MDDADHTTQALGTAGWFVTWGWGIPLTDGVITYHLQTIAMMTDEELMYAARLARGEARDQLNIRGPR